MDTVELTADQVRALVLVGRGLTLTTIREYERQLRLAGSERMRQGAYTAAEEHAHMCAILQAAVETMQRERVPRVVDIVHYLHAVADQSEADQRVASPLLAALASLLDEDELKLISQARGDGHEPD
ncbi:MAG: hypothetical protein AB7Y46_01685 [Armatimonadota bacterium]